MKLLPLRNIVLHTQLTTAECADKLQQNTTPWSLDHLFKRDPKGRLFVGEVQAGFFNIRHIIEYNNAFLPIAHGTFKPIDGGTEVAIAFKPHRIAVRFAYVLLAIALAGMAALIIAGIYGSFEKEMLVLPSTLVVVTTVIHTSVKAEYENSRQLLMKILKSPE